LVFDGLGYSYYSSNQQKKKEKEKFEVYRMITESENDLYQEYLSKNPEIKEDYCQWLEAKNYDL
jgi:NAD+--asparagine ADP-ribosyltransferase